MPENTACPSCQRMLRVPDDLKGQSVRCPSCGSVFTAGVDSPPPLPPPEPPPVEREPVREAAAQPRRRRALPDDDDYDDRDDDYDRPRRRRRRLDYEPHRGGTILALGIVSCVICGIILGPIAWSMGSSDLRSIRERRMDPEGEGMTRAGMICGIVGTCLHLVGCVFYAMFFAVAGAGRRF